ncbi:MAG: hypothetical protein H0U08_00625 [Actinobacteria bacterium]|nr:hypothetical protein [Actinomycetota bacterium]
MRRIVVAALLVSLVAGLVSTASASTTTRRSIPGAGASIVIPTAWSVLDRRTVTSSVAFKRFIDENPSLRPFVAQMAGANSAIKLMAFDLDLSQGFATNINVVLSGPAPRLSLTQIAAIYRRELEARLSTIVGPVATSAVTLPAGKAVRASYKVRFVNQGRRLTVQTLQYLVLGGDKSLVVTFSTLPAQASRRNGTFAAIARSLRFTS